MGYVYFIRKENQNVFKIGMTTNAPETRLKQIQTSTPDRLSIFGVLEANSPRRLESELHERYKEHRIMGEWFRLDPGKLRNFIDSHPHNIPNDWIELKSGHSKIFWFHIPTEELYIDFSSLRGFSNLYLASLLTLTADDLKLFNDGSMAVKFDIFAADWPEEAAALEEQKQRLLKSAIEYMDIKNDTN